MLKLAPDSELYRFRPLFNGYAIVNEASHACRYTADGNDRYESDMVYCDDYYGRFFTGGFLNKIEALYGDSRLNFYTHGPKISLPVIREYRVPYRRIPVYKAQALSEIQSAIRSIADANPDYIILLRGQNEVYTLTRPDDESEYLYGDSGIIEPSFMPSLVRKRLSPGELTSMWHNLADILLGKLSDNGERVPEYFRHAEAFNLFALGIAQHYGLPSVGLDLTDDLLTALWFALNRATYSSESRVKAELIGATHEDANIYVFRCPRFTVYSYDALGINIGDERPRRQKAYFNYCGWGLAKNQLALNLAAVFNVDASFVRYLPDDYTSYLFPSVEEDKVLCEALAIRDQYKGSYFGDLLQNIYL